MIIDLMVALSNDDCRSKRTTAALEKLTSATLHVAQLHNVRDDTGKSRIKHNIPNGVGANIKRVDNVSRLLFDEQPARLLEAG